MNFTTRAILKQVEALGWIVKTFRINGTIEIHAVSQSGVDPPQVARCNNGDGADEEYLAAVLIAAAVGIDLEDG